MPTRTSKQLVSEANALVETIAPEDAAKLVGNPEVQFVDIREPGEVAKSGLVAGAVNVPRGLLEFQVDPESPTHNAKLAAGSRLVLYCGSGARSALAAKSLKDMGVENVAHVPGGFSALKDAGAVIAPE
ncbi:rhodanese-like domain-containing protein [Sphingomonas sp. CCH21-G11]|jgi:rhodanese-related sulfurtransferase|uniref:rhodanese-like domain-containing protein n=1 Tax=Sphingomonas sp. CCH21-G11 TaxID=1768749 RepID=UPI0009E6F999|nr:rhodanese-like domain-containing protein [Sphingomonas sp. CCH21-G11]